MTTDLQLSKTDADESERMIPQQQAWPLAEAVLELAVRAAAPDRALAAAGNRTAMNGEKYGVSCPSGDIFYKVLWTTDSARADQAIVDTCERTIGTPKRNFTITGDPAIVGSKVSGSWTDERGRARYSCVWQYDRYPIALVVTGASASSVSPACDAVTVYDNAQLAGRVG